METLTLKEITLIATLKKISLFIITIFVSRIFILDTNLILSIPLFIFSFMMGYSYILTYLLGLVMTSLIFKESMLYLLANILLVYLSIEICKLRFQHAIKVLPFISFSSIIITLGFIHLNNIINLLPSILISASICYYLTWQYLQMIPLFNHQQHSVVKKEWCFALIMLFTTTILELIKFYDFFLLLPIICFLLGYYLFDSEEMLSITIAYSIILYFYINSVGLVSIFLVPFTMFNLYKPITKLGYSAYYIFIVLLMYFFNGNNSLITLLTTILAIMFFLSIPEEKYKKMKVLLGKELIKDSIGIQNKIANQIEMYGELFDKLGGCVNTKTSDVNINSYLENVYSCVCSNCTGRLVCYNKNRYEKLIAYINKGVSVGLDEDEKQYVEKNCVHPEDYLRIITDQNKMFNDDLNSLEVSMNIQDILQNQLNALALLLKEFSNDLKSNNMYEITERRVKEVLGGYNFEVVYTKINGYSSQEHVIELGILGTNISEVEQIVIPLLEETINTSLEVIEISEVQKQAGYIRLRVANKKQYYLQYGIYQYSKDHDYCGDSYYCFNDNNKQYLLLSDGMGFGKKAHDESKMCVEIFEKMIKSNIDIKQIVTTLNALLKLRNTEDMYTTLDLFAFDNKKAIGQFLKNGATPSCIISDLGVKKVRSGNLPIGIIDEVDMHLQVYQLQKEDIIIMFSDGLDEKLVKQEAEYIDKKDNPQIIARKIYEEIANRKPIDDDATIIVGKVISR